ncbi:MAG: TPM domain-containing protein [Erysipelotrichaceae bacterium]|nr:TPM domain-containing protein [Erysipelotrichaceae bacterium]MBR3167194.1 TPM domain-containing protein [Erysipelotrichaceae bacterium]
MKKLIALAVFLLFLIVPFTVRADKVYVIDNAGLLSEQERSDLEDKLERISAEVKADVVVLTESDLNGQDVVAYADDFFDYNGYGQGKHYDGVLLMLAMDTRTWYISTSGSGIRAFTDYRIEVTGDDMMPYLRDGDYYGAFNEFADLAEGYFRDQIGDYMLYDNGDLVTFDDDGNIITETNIASLEENVMYAITDRGKIVEASSLEELDLSFTYFMIENGEMYEVRPEIPEPPREPPYLEVGLGSGATGLLASAFYVARERSKLRSVNKKYQASEYYRKGSMDIRSSRDIFLYRNVSRTRIQTSSSSSGGHSSGGGGGGSHVHISSSGHTHGGGGGHF